MNDDVQRVYDQFLRYNVTDSGCPANGYRVTLGTNTGFSGNQNDTYSESIGWGMLIAVYMDNRTNDTKKYFDGFNRYRKSYLNQNGLMKWKIDQSGKLYGDHGTAVEADENMALARR